MPGRLAAAEAAATLPNTASPPPPLHLPPSSSNSPLALLHDLGRHPAGGAHKGVARHHAIAPAAPPLQRGGHTKVRQQHLAAGVQQDVAGLQAGGGRGQGGQARGQGGRQGRVRRQGSLVC